MKFRNQFLKYKFQEEQNGDGGNGDGGNREGAANNSDNNGANNTDEFVNLWNKPAGDQQQQVQPQSQQAPNQQQQPGEAMRKHLDSLDLMNGLDLKSAVDEHGNVDFDKQQGMIQSGLENAYTAMLTSANKMIQEQVAKAQEQAVSKAGANFESQTLIRQMNADLPFTADSKFAPLANSVLTRLIQNGKSPNDAIKSVKNYFAELSGAVGAETPLAGNDAHSKNAAGKIDWGSIMGGQ